MNIDLLASPIVLFPRPTKPTKPLFVSFRHAHLSMDNFKWRRLPCTECVFYSARTLLKQIMAIKVEIIVYGLYKIGYLEVCGLSCWDCHGGTLAVLPGSKPLRRTWSSLASMYTQASGGRRQRSPAGAARRKGYAASAGKQQNNVQNTCQCSIISEGLF